MPPREPPRRPSREAPEAPLFVPLRQLAAAAGRAAFLASGAEDGPLVLLAPPPARSVRIVAVAGSGPAAAVRAEDADAALAADTTEDGLRFRAAVAFALGRMTDARHALEALVALRGEEPADALSLATIAFEQGDAEFAAQAAARAAAGAEAAENGVLAGLALVLEGEARVAMGDMDWGESAARRGMAELWTSGHVPATLVGLARWGRLLLALARPDEAARMLVRARELAAATGEDAGGAEVARLEAALAVATSAPEGTALAGRLVARARAAHEPVALAEALLLQGTAAFQHGSRAAAREAIDEARRLADALGLGRLVARLAAAGRPDGPPGVPGAPGRWHGLADAVERAAREGAEPALRAAAAALAGALGAARGLALLADGFEIRAAVRHGPPGADAEVLGLGPVEHVLVTGEAIFIEDMATHPAFAARPLVRAQGLRGAAALPLATDDGLIGALAADGPHPLPALSEADRAALVRFARRAAGAIAAACRAEAAAFQAETLAGAYRAALAAAAAATPEALLRALAPEAARLCGAERLVLLAGDAVDALTPIARHEPIPAAPPSMTIARWVYAHARPLHLLDPSEEEPFRLHASVETLGPRTADVVPVVYQGRTLGVLYTDHARIDAATGPAGLAGLAHLGEIAGAFLARG